MWFYMQTGNVTKTTPVKVSQSVCRVPIRLPLCNVFYLQVSFYFIKNKNS